MFDFLSHHLCIYDMFIIYINDSILLGKTKDIHFILPMISNDFFFSNE